MFFCKSQSQNNKKDSLNINSNNVSNVNIANVFKFKDEISKANDSQILVVFKNKYYSYEKIKDSIKVDSSIRIISDKDSILKYFDKRINKILIIN